MTKRDILSIALKILGIISVTNAVMSIHFIGMGISMLLEQAKFPNLQNYYNPYWFLGAAIVTLVLWLAVAYLLLRWGDLFAKKLVRDDKEVHIFGTNQEEKLIFILCIRVIGVVCIVMGIPQLIRVLPDLIVSVEKHHGNIASHIWGGIISAIVLLVIGIYLLSGGKHLVDFAYRGGKDYGRGIQNG